MPVLEMSDRVHDLLDAIENGQQTVLDGSRGVADSVAEALSEIPVPDPIPTPAEIVDATFDFAEKVLVSQQKFTRELFETGEGAVSRPQAAPKTASKAAPRAKKPAKATSA